MTALTNVCSFWGKKVTFPPIGILLGSGTDGRILNNRKAQRIVAFIRSTDPYGYRFIFI